LIAENADRTALTGQMSSLLKVDIVMYVFFLIKMNILNQVPRLMMMMMMMMTTTTTTTTIVHVLWFFFFVQIN